MAAKTIYAVADGNWDAANNWADNADGSGSTYTNPQNGVDTYICMLNGKTITINVAVSVDKITNAGAGGLLSIPDGASATVTVATADEGFSATFVYQMTSWVGGGSLTINGDVKYSGTNTSGMITYTTGQTVIVNGKVTNSSSGYALVGSGSGVLTISNVGGTAVSNSGSGRGVEHGSTGALSITGNRTNSSTGICVRSSGVCTATITGDGIATNGVDITSASGSGTISVDGNVSSSGSGRSFVIAGGALTWTGARTQADSTDCYIQLSGGTLAIADGTGALDLTLGDHSHFTIYKTGGTLTTTSGANTAAIDATAAYAGATIIGGTDANKEIISKGGGGAVTAVTGAFEINFIR